MWLNRDSRVTCLLECFYSHPRWHERLFQYHYASLHVWSYNQFWNTGQTSCLSHYSHSKAPLGFLTVPQREWSLTLSQHLLVVLLLELRITFAFPFIALHQHGCLYSTVKTVSRSDQFLTNNILKHVFLDLFVRLSILGRLKLRLRRTFELRYGLPSLLYRPRHVIDASPL